MAGLIWLSRIRCSCWQRSTQRWLQILLFIGRDRLVCLWPENIVVPRFPAVSAMASQLRNRQGPLKRYELRYSSGKTSLYEYVRVLEYLKRTTSTGTRVIRHPPRSVTHRKKIYFSPFSGG